MKRAVKPKPVVIDKKKRYQDTFVDGLVQYLHLLSSKLVGEGKDDDYSLGVLKGYQSIIDHIKKTYKDN